MVRVHRVINARLWGALSRIALTLSVTAWAAMAFAGTAYGATDLNGSGSNVYPMTLSPLGGTYALGSDGRIQVPAGAVGASTDITCTIITLVNPNMAEDGGSVYTAAKMEPSGLTFNTSITVSLAYPANVGNPRAYWLDEGQDKWVSQTSMRNGDKVITDIGHFSIYGIGGDLIPPVPASSPWSLGLLVLIGGGAILLRTRRSSRNLAV